METAVILTFTTLFCVMFLMIGLIGGWIVKQYQVERIYGIRKISSGKFNIAGDFEGTLDQTIIDELSKKEISDINLMLGKKGIKYKF